MDNLDLLDKLAQIPGGYVYHGAASYQVCFPLKAGGELRLAVTEEHDDLVVDLYDGGLPGISGPTRRTG